MKYSYILLSLIAVIFAVGCVSQTPHADFRITEVTLSETKINQNQTSMIFITIKNFDEIALNVTVQLSAVRDSDAPYLIFEPEQINYGILKQGEEVRKSISLRALLPAGEVITYKFKIELVTDMETLDTKEREITVSRE